MMYRFSIAIIAFSCVGCISSNASKILAVFPVPAISHQLVFRPYTQELAKRGHEVIIITPNPAFSKTEAPENIKEIDVHDISYEIWNNFLALESGNKNNLATQLAVSFRLLATIFQKQMLSVQVQKLFRDKELFDLLILEGCVRPALSLSHIFKVPVIQFNTLGDMFNSFEIMGAASHPLLYPKVTRQKTHDLSAWDKITEMWSNYNNVKGYIDLEESENKEIKQIFGPDTPTLDELSNNIDMYFVNVHPMWDSNRPVPPSVVYLGGGFHIGKPKDLSQDLKSYLDSSKNGVIYMSFGTNCNASRLHLDKIKMIGKVFSALPYNVLWKWETDSWPVESANVKIAKWFPQFDILWHPNIKLFITQGGLQSTDEAIAAEVPLLGIPMLGDQWFNTEKYVHFGIGMKLNFDELTEEEFHRAVVTVIEDGSYRNNIAKLRLLMQDQPQSPLERAIWWTEHLLKYGGKHLRSPAANMNWAKYYEISLILIVLSTVISISVIVKCMFRCLKSKELRTMYKSKKC